MRRPAVHLLIGATVTVLGLNWPIMARGVRVIPPLWLSAFRLGGACLVIAVALRLSGRLRRPRREDVSILASIGLGQLALVNALVFLALGVVAPGRSSIIVYTSSLWTVPIATMVLHERLTRRRVVGVSIGCAGLVLLIEPWALDWSDTALVAGVAMLLVAAVTNAATTVHVRAHGWNGTPFELMPWLLGIATIPVAVLAVVVDGVPEVDWNLTTGWIVAYQILLGSAFGTWGLLTLARSLPAISANLALMAVPVIGVASSALIVDEAISVGLAASLVLVLIGVGTGLSSDER